jgi:hypothetical protein
MVGSGEALFVRQTLSGPVQEAGPMERCKQLSACKTISVAIRTFLVQNVLVASKREIAQRFLELEPWLDEHMRRLWAAAERAALGRGGVSLVARASGVSRRAIAVGLVELKPTRQVVPPQGSTALDYS